MKKISLHADNSLLMVPMTALSMNLPDNLITPRSKK